MHGSKATRAAALGMSALLIAALTGGSAGAITKQIDVVDNAFSPDSWTMSVSGTITWAKAATGAPHSVHQEKNLFDSGSPTTSSFSFSRAMSAGVFRYMCEFHPTTMTGTIKVPVTLLADADDTASLPLIRWATNSTNTGDRFDVQYKVGSGAWKTWLTDRTSNQAIFGDDDPVNLQVGTVYRFRARSQKGSTATRVSRWSPPVPYEHD